MRRSSGSATSAAPTSSPIPWTTLNTPGGKPASSASSASSEQDSGDHSAGLSTTVQPAASAGAIFQVESMNGAFHGVITADRAGRHPLHAVPGSVRVPVALLVGHREVGVAAEVARPAGDHPRPQRAQQHRHVGALDRGQALDVRVDQVGQAVQVARRGRRRRAPPSRGTRRPPRRRRGRTVGRVGPGHLGQHALIDRRDGLEALGAGDALAADEVVGRDGLTRRPARSRPCGCSSPELPDRLEVVDRVGEA